MGDTHTEFTRYQVRAEGPRGNQVGRVPLQGQALCLAFHTQDFIWPLPEILKVDRSLYSHILLI